MGPVLNYSTRKAVTNPAVDRCNNDYSLHKKKKNLNVKEHSPDRKKGKGHFLIKGI